MASPTPRLQGGCRAASPGLLAMTSSSHSDVLIVGAGPAGLSLAISLAQAGFTTTVVEQQSEATLAHPAPDGREIALTHPSVATLQRLGTWAGLAPHEGGTIREAQGHDGPLGQRSAPPPRPPRPPLLVAADSRFSATRRQLGIGARMTDFGRTVIVCRMRHAQPHGGVAHECFGYERTLAVLPLPNDPQEGHALCSVVVTAGTADAGALLAQSPQAFAATVQAQLGDRLGPLQLEGERHAYPLVAVYAQRFADHRCALLGDAAVGMHPVTAHGYNLGLAGVERLTAAVVAARSQGHDIGNGEALAT